MVQDFLDKFKSIWTPAKILSAQVSGIELPQISEADAEDVAVAEAFADHLNTILDYKDRIDAFNFLSDQAKSNFTDVSYTTADESLVNAIIQIGGKDGTVDFQLACDAVNLVLEWIELTAADSISASYLGKI